MRQSLTCGVIFSVFSGQLLACARLSDRRDVAKTDNRDVMKTRSREIQDMCDLGPVSRKFEQYLFGPGKLFCVCCVCIQEQSFNNFENNTMKLSVSEAKLTVSWARNCATIQLVWILKFAFRTEK